MSDFLDLGFNLAYALGYQAGLHGPLASIAWCIGLLVGFGIQVFILGQALAVLSVAWASLAYSIFGYAE